MTDTPLSDDVVERVAMKLAMFMVDTWGDAEGVVWAGLSGQSKVKATLAARSALEAARYGEMVEALRVSARAFRLLEEVAVANLEHDKARSFIKLGDRCRALLSSIGASQP